MPLKAIVASPLGLSLVLLIGAVVFWNRWPRACRAGVAVSVAVLWVASCHITVRFLAERLEMGLDAQPAGKCPNGDAIVVLGGILGESPVEALGPDLSDGTDRVLHAARLFRAGKAPWVVALGGVRFGGIEAKPEAELMTELLLEWGVPEAAILREEHSRTTYENAKFSAEILKGVGAKRILLVTSAIHMRRALKSFEAF